MMRHSGLKSAFWIRTVIHVTQDRAALVWYEQSMDFEYRLLSAGTCKGAFLSIKWKLKIEQCYTTVQGYNKFDNKESWLFITVKT